MLCNNVQESANQWRQIVFFTKKSNLILLFSEFIGKHVFMNGHQIDIEQDNICDALLQFLCLF